VVGFFSRNLVLAVAVLHLVGKRVETQVSLRVRKGIPRRACMAVVVFRDKIVEISADVSEGPRLRDAYFSGSEYALLYVFVSSKTSLR